MYYALQYAMNIKHFEGIESINNWNHGKGYCSILQTYIFNSPIDSVESIAIRGLQYNTGVMTKHITIPCHTDNYHYLE